MLAGVFVSGARKVDKLAELTGPTDNVNERAVQASCHWKQKSVRQAWQPCVWYRELTDEACGGDAVACHDERGPLLHFVRPECEDDGHDHCEDVDRDREKLGVGGRITQLLDDCRYGGGEATSVTVSDGMR